MTVTELLKDTMEDGLILAVLSGRKDGDPKKIRIRPLMLRGEEAYQAEYILDNKAHHRNISRDELADYIEDQLSKGFRQLQVRGTSLDGTVLVSKKGRASVKCKHHEEVHLPVITAHNRVKNYILPEGTPVPFLVDLGVMTSEGRVIAAKYDKFRQINRFLEYIRDVLPYLPDDREIHVLDFGCGKSYLTCALYYYLHDKEGREVRITGLDLKADVIRKCSQLAQQYGYDRLSFRTGDAADYSGEGDIDMMITLHACDTATDYALNTAVRNKARVVLSVPCCQHELNRQIKSELLEPVLRYGILKERMAALLTDGIRAELLRENGYEVQLLEFIDMEHTPKNLLIRADLTEKKETADSERLSRMMQSLNLDPALHRLLSEQ